LRVWGSWRATEMSRSGSSPRPSSSTRRYCSHSAGDADANGALQGTAAGKYAVGDVAEADGDKAATVGDSQPSESPSDPEAPALQGGGDSQPAKEEGP